MKNFVFGFVALLAASISGCGGSSESKPASAPAAPTAQDLLAKAADAAVAMKTASFDLRREGAPVLLDEKTNVSFTEATCKYQSPDRVDCQIKVQLKTGNILSVQKIWIPEGIYMTNPLTKSFMKLNQESSFNGALLFGPQGFPSLVKNSIRNAAIVGKESLEGADTIHIKGELDGQKLAPLMAGTISPDHWYPADLWIKPDSHLPARLHVAEPDGSGWRIDVYSYDEPVNIVPPQTPTPRPAAQ